MGEKKALDLETVKRVCATYETAADQAKALGYALTTWRTMRSAYISR